jgi:aryl-alcohol dehydrogenase-like predicted oxidoreductase
MDYRRTGNSGFLLPELSLGLWHNFGKNDNFENARNLLKCAFDNGITHFDLVNNYDPPYGRYLKTDKVLEMLPKIKALNEIAKNRNQNLAQMAISWILKDDRITSVLIGASKTSQIIDSVKATENTSFSDEELVSINAILK